MNNEDIFKRHITDLAQRSYDTGIFTFTNFLSEAEQSDIISLKLDWAGLEFRGINMPGDSGDSEDSEKTDSFIENKIDFSERKIARFGKAEDLGYDEDFPIVCIKFSPLSEKFGEELSHRDWLGAIMNLGIERELIGDIFVSGKSAYVICLDRISGFLTENLTHVRHTTVKSEIADFLPDDCLPKYKEAELLVASERLDLVISKLYNLSRNQSTALFKSGKVFLNGKEVYNAGTTCKENDLISVRGFGRFRYQGILRQSQKGKYYIRLIIS